MLTFALLTSAFANERAFTYTYDTRVLPQGAREIEPWIESSAAYWEHRQHRADREIDQLVDGQDIHELNRRGRDTKARHRL